MNDKDQPTILSIPGWGMDRHVYDGLCRYLGFAPTPALHEKVCRYLLRAAATRPSPTGFARWLAERRPGRVALGFLDPATRLLMPENPWRHRLNAVIAVHECDPAGYLAMNAGAGSRLGAWAFAVSSAGALILGLVPGALWFGGQAFVYLICRGAWRRERAHFDGMTVLVTGASRGLGLSLAGRLLSLGAQVVAVAREGATLRVLREQAVEAGWGDRLHIVAADVATPDAIRDALSAAGLDGRRIDVAVINAGIKEAPVGADTEETLRRTFAVNFFGAVQTATALLPEWEARRSGHFIFISSLGRWHGMVRTGAYNASKAALSIFAESMAMDLRVQGTAPIRVTIVEPGLIRTGMVGHGGMQSLLAVDAGSAARRILQCAAKGCPTCRFPFLFTLMTALIAMLPMRLRVRILGRVKGQS